MNQHKRETQMISVTNPTEKVSALLDEIAAKDYIKEGHIKFCDIESLAQAGLLSASAYARKHKLSIGVVASWLMTNKIKYVKFGNRRFILPNQPHPYNIKESAKSRKTKWIGQQYGKLH